MSYIPSSSIRSKFSYEINFWNINEPCPIKHYWSNMESIFHPKFYKTNQWILLGLRFLDLIRYLEKKNLGSDRFRSDLNGFYSIIQIPIKYMLFFVCNGYGSVQIFRTQIKLDKHKYTRNTKKYPKSKQIPENQIILKRPKIVLEIWPEEPKNTQNFIWIPKYIFKFWFCIRNPKL